MLILTIRTEKPDSEIGLYKDNDQIDYFTWPAHRQLAETINVKINELLDKNSYKLEDIKGILVFKGPGSFTGLRIGISVANALAYGLDIPIVGAKEEPWIKNGINELLAGNNQKIITPFYGSDVHITLPKK